jgi:hypothetical protein
VCYKFMTLARLPADTQPYVHPGLLTLSAIISQYVEGVLVEVARLNLRCSLPS